LQALHAIVLSSEIKLTEDKTYTKHTRTDSVFKEVYKEVALKEQNWLQN